MNSSALSTRTSQNPHIGLSNRPAVQPAPNDHESKKELNGANVPQPGRARKSRLKRMALTRIFHSWSQNSIATCFLSPRPGTNPRFFKNKGMQGDWAADRGKILRFSAVFEDTSPSRVLAWLEVLTGCFAC